MHPRADNGTEDAHDYLWLTQDLWMEPDVWQWVNENPDVKSAILQHCEKCFVREKRVAEFKQCSACRIVCLRKFLFGWNSHLPVIPRYDIVVPNVRRKIGLRTNQVCIIDV